MRIRDKEFFRLFLIVYTLMFVIIFQCFDIINKMQAELKGSQQPEMKSIMK